MVCYKCLKSYKMASNRSVFNIVTKCINPAFKRLPSSHIKRYLSSSKKLWTKADIVISGGGMVGASMACLLAQNEMFKNKRIVLLEAGSDRGEFKLPENYSNRVSALSPYSVQLLKGLGAWDEIQNLRYQSVKRMQIWESCSEAYVTYNHPDMALELSHVVENDVIIASIMKKLKTSGSNVEIFYNTTASNYKFPGELDDENNKMSKVSVHLNNGQKITTDLLIGADGSNSVVRKKANFQTLSRDYGQKGVVATLHLSETPDNTVAWQRFLQTGPIALLPLGPNCSSLVWSTSTENAKDLLNMPEDSFVDALNDSIWNDQDQDPVVKQILNSYSDFLQNFVPAGLSSRQIPPTVVGIQKNSRGAFPLALTHSSCYVRHRVALIGDAAHRVHPLAGQGVNLGFGDVQCLDKHITLSLREGCDPGSITNLFAYETERLRQNIPVMAVVDGLSRLYSSNITPLVLLRSLGLQSINSLDFVKEQIIKQAAVR